MVWNTLFNNIALLAQEGGAEGPPLPWWPMLAGLGLLAYFLLIRPSSRERREHARMLEDLKKNDRVVTIGGIFGTVVEVKPDRIVLRVDEGNNARLNVLRSSIARLVVEEKGSFKESVNK